VQPDSERDVDGKRARLKNLISDACEAATLEQMSVAFPNERIRIEQIHFKSEGGEVGDLIHPDDYIKKMVALHHSTWIVRPLREALSLLKEFSVIGLAAKPADKPEGNAKCGDGGLCGAGGYCDGCKAEQQAESVITAEALLRSVFTRPDLSEQGRSQFLKEFMDGKTELTLGWSDFRMMAATARAAHPPAQPQQLSDEQIVKAPETPDGWKQFGAKVLFDARENFGDVNGGDIQDWAIEAGLLTENSATESCGEGCRCAEYGFPTECYRYSDEASKEINRIAAPTDSTARTE
jgi:hypothetical protein